MFSPASGSQIWLCCTPTDMRKSHDGLSALVRQTLRDDPLTGALYVFRQLLLHCPTFRHPWRSDETVKQTLARRDWQCIIEGIDLRSVRRLKRYELPESDRR